MLLVHPVFLPRIVVMKVRWLSPELSRSQTYTLFSVVDGTFSQMIFGFKINELMGNSIELQHVDRDHIRTLWRNGSTCLGTEGKF